ncbi:hypothetical protein BDV3_002420 [Batrachochytrium dendrobatidis]|nr:hypothetical protein BDEG_27603 [Batrachochytrium dendrobatidis JEL423]
MIGNRFTQQHTGSSNALQSSSPDSRTTHRNAASALEDLLVQDHILRSSHSSHPVNGSAEQEVCPPSTSVETTIISTVGNDELVQLRPSPIHASALVVPLDPIVSTTATAMPHAAPAAEPCCQISMAFASNTKSTSPSIGSTLRSVAPVGTMATNASLQVPTAAATSTVQDRFNSSNSLASGLDFTGLVQDSSTNTLSTGHGLDLNKDNHNLLSAHDSRRRSSTPAARLSVVSDGPSPVVNPGALSIPYPSSKAIPLVRRNSSADLTLLWGMERLSLERADKSPDTNLIRPSGSRHITLNNGVDPSADGISLSSTPTVGEAKSGAESTIPHQFSDKFMLDDDSVFNNAYSRSFFPTSSDEPKMPILKRRESYSTGSMASFHQQKSTVAQSSIYSSTAWPTVPYSTSKSVGGMAGESNSISCTSGFSSIGSFSSDLQLPISTNAFGLSDTPSFEKLRDASFYPQKPTALAPSFSSPDLGAFRINGSLGDLIEQQEQYLMMQQNAAQSQMTASGGDLDAASIPGSYGICRYFLQGYCSRGDRCNFAHIMNMGALSNNGTQSMQSSLSNPIGINNTNNSMQFNPNANALSMSGISPQTAAALYSQSGMSGMNNGFNMMYSGLPYNAQGLPFANMSNLNALKFHATLQKQKKHSQEEASRFSSIMLEDLVGQISVLSKDQHGCRYLQRKLEEQNEKHLDMIYVEIFPNFAELMTDPFGNYLCQKLLEYCTEEQRNMLVEHVAPDLAAVSLNMHGTRAVQKLIEFLSTHHQISTVVRALALNVVSLIKDLNGNHVIQKCLNRLSHENNQFIYNAVRKHCTEIATHRHGCCVLQRCIDHASDSQRVQLVAEITYHALTLVQDPFGNYVVQYVLDLAEIKFSEAIVHRFLGNICLLSVQKFSSNVIEKCIRVASSETRALLIDELLNKERLDKLLRDSYANYVVQTSLDYAEPAQRLQLVECIRPILPSIRNTPYGKRIQTKILRDHFNQVSNGLGGMGTINMLSGPGQCYNDIGLAHGMGNSMNKTSSFSGLVGMNGNNSVLSSMGSGMNGMF